jgi:hypothetical protein
LPPTPAPGGVRPSAPPPPRRDALASAFHRDVTSAAAPPATVKEEWYVAINGVPVGPISAQEVKRRAAAGSVTDASLAWREGMEEWRAVRMIPELSVLVSDALFSRPASIRPPAPRDAGPSLRPAGSTPAPRSNVVPFRAPSSMAPAASLVGNAAVATAADPFQNYTPDPFVPAADPFAAPPSADRFAPRTNPGQDPVLHAPIGPKDLAQPSLESFAPPQRKKGFPIMALALLVCVGAFGGVAAFVLLSKPKPPEVVIKEVPGAVQIQTVYIERGTTAPESSGTTASTAVVSNGKGGAIAKAATSAPSGSSSAADLSGLLGGGSGPGGPKGSGLGSGSGTGGSLTQEDVQRTVGTYQNSVKRKCWDTAAPNTPTANVNAAITVAADGSVSSVTATGNDPMVAKCIEGQVRNWRFSAPGGKTTVNVPFKFVRQ